MNAYGQQASPAWWDTQLYKAGMFHARMLQSVSDPSSVDGRHCIEHHSQCVLNNNVSNCDGSPSCACQGGTASCDFVGTSYNDRIFRFSNSPSGEIVAHNNIDSYIFTTFHNYLFEDGHYQTGHRAAIVDGNNAAVGIGNYDGFNVGEFGSYPLERPAITSGSHYYARSNWSEYNIGDGRLWFKMHYFANSPVAKATMNLGGQCYNLSNTRGSSTNGTWGISLSDPAGCTPYFYETTDSSGRYTRYPTIGALLFNCSQSWTASSSGVSCQNGGSNQANSFVPNSNTGLPSANINVPEENFAPTNDYYAPANDAQSSGPSSSLNMVHPERLDGRDNRDVFDGIEGLDEVNSYINQYSNSHSNQQNPVNSQMGNSGFSGDNSYQQPPQTISYGNNTQYWSDDVQKIVEQYGGGNTNNAYKTRSMNNTNKQQNSNNVPQQQYWGDDVQKIVDQYGVGD